MRDNEVRKGFGLLKDEHEFSTRELFKMFIVSLVKDVANLIKNTFNKYVLKKVNFKKIKIKREQSLIIVRLSLFFILIISLYVNNESSYNIDNFEKVSVTIGMGNTVWEAQKTLTPEKDINKMIWLDKSINNKGQLDNVKVGEEVYLLKEK